MANTSRGVEMGFGTDGAAMRTKKVAQMPATTPPHAESPMKKTDDSVDERPC